MVSRHWFMASWYLAGTDAMYSWNEWVVPFAEVGGFQGEEALLATFWNDVRDETDVRGVCSVDRGQADGGATHIARSIHEWVTATARAPAEPL